MMHNDGFALETDELHNRLWKEAMTAIDYSQLRCLETTEMTAELKTLRREILLQRDRLEKSLREQKVQLMTERFTATVKALDADVKSEELPSLSYCTELSKLQTCLSDIQHLQQGNHINTEMEDSVMNVKHLLESNKSILLSSLDDALVDSTKLSSVLERILVAHPDVFEAQLKRILQQSKNICIDVFHRFETRIISIPITAKIQMESVSDKSPQSQVRNMFNTAVSLWTTPSQEPATTDPKVYGALIDELKEASIPLHRTIQTLRNVYAALTRLVWTKNQPQKTLQPWRRATSRSLCFISESFAEAWERLNNTAVSATSLFESSSTEHENYLYAIYPQLLAQLTMFHVSNQLGLFNVNDENVLEMKSIVCASGWARGCLLKMETRFIKAFHIKEVKPFITLLQHAMLPSSSNRDRSNTSVVNRRQIRLSRIANISDQPLRYNSLTALRFRRLVRVWLFGFDPQIAETFGDSDNWHIHTLMKRHRDMLGQSDLDLTGVNHFCLMEKLESISQEMLQLTRQGFADLLDGSEASSLSKAIHVCAELAGDMKVLVSYLGKGTSLLSRVADELQLLVGRMVNEWLKRRDIQLSNHLLHSQKAITNILASDITNVSLVHPLALLPLPTHSLWTRFPSILSQYSDQLPPFPSISFTSSQAKVTVDSLSSRRALHATAVLLAWILSNAVLASTTHCDAIIKTLTPSSQGDDIVDPAPRHTVWELVIQYVETPLQTIVTETLTQCRQLLQTRNIVEILPNVSGWNSRSSHSACYLLLLSLVTVRCVPVLAFPPPIKDPDILRDIAQVFVTEWISESIKRLWDVQGNSDSPSISCSCSQNMETIPILIRQLEAQLLVGTNTSESAKLLELN